MSKRQPYEPKLEEARVFTQEEADRVLAALKSAPEDKDQLDVLLDALREEETHG